MNPELNTDVEQNLVLGLQELSEDAANGGVATPDVMGLHSFISVMTDCGTGGYFSMFCTM